MIFNRKLIFFWQHFCKFKRSRRGLFHALKMYHMPQFMRESLQELVASDFILYHKMTIPELLKECGFKNVVRLEPRETTIPQPGRLNLEERAWDSFYVEAKK